MDFWNKFWEIRRWNHRAPRPQLTRQVALVGELSRRLKMWRLQGPSPGGPLHWRPTISKGSTPLQRNTKPYEGTLSGSISSQSCTVVSSQVVCGVWGNCSERTWALHRYVMVVYLVQHLLSKCRLLKATVYGIYINTYVANVWHFGILHEFIINLKTNNQGRY